MTTQHIVQTQQPLGPSPLGKPPRHSGAGDSAADLNSLEKQQPQDAAASVADTRAPVRLSWRLYLPVLAWVYAARSVSATTIHKTCWCRCTFACLTMRSVDMQLARSASESDLDKLKTLLAVSQAAQQSYATFTQDQVCSAAANLEAACHFLHGPAATCNASCGRCMPCMHQRERSPALIR
jgi:hypothetical protein